MSDQPTAYPLYWPMAWKRTPSGRRERARFGRQSGEWINPTGVPGEGYRNQRRKSLSLPQARDRLTAELDRLGARAPVLSTNLELRLDGLPRGGQRAPDDPGVAVYFNLKGRPIVLACDRWDRVEDNVAAMAAHVGAMRGMDRWGVGNVEQAFAGYAALPAPDPTVLRPWWEVLGYSTPIPLSAAEAAYRSLAKISHPDYLAGSHAKMAELNRAIAEARAQ